MLDSDLLKQVIAGVLTAALLAYWPMRKWSSIDRSLKGLRRDMRRRDRWTRRVLRRFKRRLDAHDERHGEHSLRLDACEARLPAEEPTP